MKKNKIQVVKRDRVAEGIAVLAAMKQTNSELPDAAALFDLQKTARRRLRHWLPIALDIAEKEMPEFENYSSDAFTRLTEALDAALPKDWPAGWSSFSRNFVEVANGRSTKVKMFNAETGRFELERIYAVSLTPASSAVDMRYGCQIIADKPCAAGRAVNFKLGSINSLIRRRMQGRFIGRSHHS